MAKKKNVTLTIARTAILLAIALLSQFLFLKLIPAGIFNTLLVGSIINLVLIIATATTGMWSGVLIGLMTPLMAFLQGKLAVWFLIPIVGLSNGVLCIVFAVCLKFLPKKNQVNYILGIIIASLIKFLFMYISVKTYVPALMTSFSGFADKKIQTLIANLSTMWSYPQLLAALIGGFISLPVKMSLKKVL